MEGLLPRGLDHMASELVGRRPQFLTAWTSPWVCSRILDSLTVKEPREQGGNCNAFYVLASELHPITSDVFDWYCGATQGCKSRRQGSLGATLEAAPHHCLCLSALSSVTAVLTFLYFLILKSPFSERPLQTTPHKIHPNPHDILILLHFSL